MTFAPTDEQLHIHSLFRTGNPLLVRAGAGAGKTTTLLQLADILGEQGRSGLYLAFNKSIATEAGRKFPRHMMSSTAHALAFRGLRGTAHAPLLDKLEMGKVPFSVTERELGILPMTARGPDGRQRVISAYQITRQVLRTVEEFCKTTDQEIGPHHVPPMIGLDSRGEHHNQHALVEHVLPLAVKAWRDVYSTSGTAVKFSHGHYLKLWAMIRPRFGPEGAALFLDEAQDCQPAGTLVQMVGGTTKPIEDIKVGDRVLTYTGQSLRLRMRGCEVATVASRQYAGDIVRVETEAGLATRYTPEHITFAKLSGAFDSKKLVYLMRRGDKYRVGITSAYHGTEWTRRSSGLAGRMAEERGDAMWVLGAFDTKVEALVEEARASVTFGIPDLVFHVDDRGKSAWGQERLDDFWAELGDMTEKAAACLESFGRMIEHPILTRKYNENGNRAGYLMLTRACTIRACNLMDGMQVLDARPLIDRIDQRARRAGDPAWTPAKITREQFDDTVYSLEVEGDHTYIGDDIVTHNCSPVLAGVLAEQTHLQQVFVGDSSQSIYRFTGARNAMREFGNVSEGRLTQSWRFGPAIADAANELLADLGDDMRLKGNPSLLSRVTTREPTVDAVLTRTNGVALERVMAAQASGVRVHLMGDQKYALRFCEGAENLQNGNPAGHEDLAAFTTWGQVQDHAQDSPDSADWKTLVALIDDHGVPAVKTALAHSVPEASAQLVVATAHRSKGREWDRVELASDLDEALQEATEAAEEGGAADKAALRDEQMLCYVAVTRAKTALAPGGVIAPELYTAATPPVVGMTSVFGEAAARERTAGESVSVTVEFSAAELSQISGTAGGDLALWLHRLALAAAEHGRIAS